MRRQSLEYMSVWTLSNLYGTISCSNIQYYTSVKIVLYRSITLHTFSRNGTALFGIFQGIPYEIDDDIEVISTPGHTGSDVSVIVRNTKHGIVAVTGK